MGIFSGIKSMYKKSEAAVVVENLLKQERDRGQFQGDPAKVANQMVESCWEVLGEMFTGKYMSQRPHKISVAAQSLAKAVQDSDPSDPNYMAYGLALGRVLQTAEDYQKQLGLVGGDFGFLDDAFETFKKQQDELGQLQ